MLVKAPANGKVLWSSIVTRNGHAQLRANTYYRVLVPFMTARDMGLINDFFVEGFSSVSPHATKEEQMLMALLSDVMVLSNVFGEQLVKNALEIRKLKAMIDEDSLEKMYPPVIIFDQDDLTEYVSIFNDTFSSLGSRSPSGEILNEGDEIFLKSSVEGEPDLLMWRDGACPGCLADNCAPGVHAPFDVADNRRKIDLMYDLARAAHGATFTTDRLSAFYRDEVGVKNVYTFPNSIYLKDYRRVDLAEHPDEVRLLWQGGSSHFADWQPYAAALGRVLRKYPHTKMMMWGQPFPYILKQLPEEQLEFIEWVPHAAYLARLNTLGHDINLAPLEHNKFNECKSSIKWYESSAITRPAATLASRVPPYSDEMLDGQTGLMFHSEEEFENQLCRLIEDATLRKELASNAKDWVLENRDSRITVPPLLEWYWELRKEYDT